MANGKRTNNDLQNTTQKTKDSETHTSLKTSDAQDEQVVTEPFVLLINYKNIIVHAYEIGVVHEYTKINTNKTYKT